MDPSCPRESSLDTYVSLGPLFLSRTAKTRDRQDAQLSAPSSHTHHRAVHECAGGGASHLPGPREQLPSRSQCSTQLPPSTRALGCPTTPPHPHPPSEEPLVPRGAEGAMAEGSAGSRLQHASPPNAQRAVSERGFLVWGASHAALQTAQHTHPSRMHGHGHGHRPAPPRVEPCLSLVFLFFSFLNFLAGFGKIQNKARKQKSTGRRKMSRKVHCHSGTQGPVPGTNQVDTWTGLQEDTAGQSGVGF